LLQKSMIIKIVFESTVVKFKKWTKDF
jgi:hypothetical protein